MEKNCKRKFFHTFSVISTCLHSSGSSTCTNLAKSPNSPNKETICTSRTNSSKEEKCTYSFHSENNSLKSKETTKKIGPLTINSTTQSSHLPINLFQRMKSVWWTKSPKKIKPWPITKAKSGSLSCKSRKFWPKSCKNILKLWQSSKAQNLSVTRSWSARKETFKRRTIFKVTQMILKRTTSTICWQQRKIFRNLTLRCMFQDWATSILCDKKLKMGCFILD